jgi:glycolate oxidase
MLAKGTNHELARIFGKEHVRTSPEELALYGYDALPSAPLAPPDAVVFPENAEQIAELVRFANREKVPLVARGAGTNLTGGARSIRGGVVVSMQRMNKILQIDAENLQAVVLPGAITEEFQEAVLRLGLFYPPDPQSKETCTIGGNLAENAGGPRAVKYGVTRQYVLALQAVLPTGELVRLGARTLKSVVGYDLVSLLVGSEGTLGIITEATLRLIPKPEARGTLLAVFGQMGDAASAVPKIFHEKVIPSAIEFLDRHSIACVEEHSAVGLPKDAGAILVIEVDGGPGEVQENIKRIQEIMKICAARSVEVSTDEETAEKLWKARRDVGPSLARIAPHKMNEDVVVPISKLSEAILKIHSIAERHRVACACFGHAGDGNIHVNFLLHKENQDEVQRTEEAIRETFALVVSLGGSITGEHGVGTTKQPYVSMELSKEVMEAMVRVKKALDPANIMNPGKIFPLSLLEG